jgi:hypothetical protein
MEVCFEMLFFPDNTERKGFNVPFNISRINVHVEWMFFLVALIFVIFWNRVP